MKDEEILQEVLENWKGSNIYHKDVQAIAYQSISLSREDEQKRFLELIDSVFDNLGVKEDYSMAGKYRFQGAFKLLEELKQKISQLSGKEMKERK